MSIIFPGGRYEVALARAGLSISSYYFLMKKKIMPLLNGFTKICTTSDLPMALSLSLM